MAGVSRLIAAGTDVNAKRKNGATALMLASENGHEAVVAALLAAGADVNTKLPNGGMALMLASQNGHEAVVTALLKAGADVNAKLPNGGTALLTASFEGHDAVVAALLMGGADVNAKDNNGRTALDIASHRGQRQIVGVLQKEVRDAAEQRRATTTVEGSVVAREYRRRMQDEIADIETRSAQANKIDEMRSLRHQILNHLTAKVISELAASCGISETVVQQMLAANPIPSGEQDPFGKYRGPSHLLD